MGTMWCIIAVSSGLTRLRRIPVTFFERVAWWWAKARVRGAGATLNDISSLALSLSLAQSLSSFSFPFLLAVSIAEFSIVLTFGLSVVVRVHGGSHPLVIVNL